MNICKWCNTKVADHDTVWYRRNLVLGFSFCSNKCATQWKNSNSESSNNSNENNSSAKTLEELQYERDQRKLLQEQNEHENIETAKKIMALIRKLSPHWKIIIPLLIVVLSVIFFLNTMGGQIISYIYILLIIGSIWAYFTEPKK
jgi:magnesium-transporting ATPase (P-type)